MSLSEQLGTLPYTAIIGVRKETFEYPDFRKIVVKGLWRAEDAEIAALFSYYLADMFEQQQILKGALEKGEKLPEDLQMQFGTVTKYLEDALDYLSRMDTLSMEQVNLARKRIGEELTRAQSRVLVA